MISSNRCAIWELNDTTAMLAERTPICSRPCYAALLKVQRGMEAQAALVEAFREVGFGFDEAAAWARVDIGPIAHRIVERAYGANAQHFTMLPAAPRLIADRRA